MIPIYDTDVGCFVGEQVYATWMVSAVWADIKRVRSVETTLHWMCSVSGCWVVRSNCCYGQHGVCFKLAIVNFPAYWLWLTRWRFGVAVTRWSRSTQLLYIEPS